MSWHIHNTETTFHAHGNCSMKLTIKIVSISDFVLIAYLAMGFTASVHAEKGGNHGQSHAKHAKQDKAHVGQSRHYYDGTSRGKKRTKANRQNESHEWQTEIFDGSGKTHFRFDDQNRRLVQEYFGASDPMGNCPPGLAKKGTACLPPGQARQWQMNQPLPINLERYPLPPDLLRRLPSAPNGYEYVRSSSDILMITTGTNMVVDALRGLIR